MLKIKEIHFNKTTHDELPTHHVFSTASVIFTNAEPIHGALLYWEQNTTPDEYTDNGDYKYYYEMSQTQFFASVRFPESAQLSKEQRKELAFILLEERGSIGSYSVESSKLTLERLKMKKQLANFVFPTQFQAHDFSPYLTKDDAQLVYLAKKYEMQFVKDYLEWRKIAASYHPDDIQLYIPNIGMTYLCYANPHLSELFLIEHLPQIDVEALQHNLPVLSRLSSALRHYMLDTLRKNSWPLIGELEIDPEGFVENSDFFNLEAALPNEEEELPVYTYFDYERTLFEWPGAEHMVKGIPSLASQLYDEIGYKKRTNKEMDTLLQSFDPEQIRLFSAVAELHWLHRYRAVIDWSVASRFNPHLDDAFLTALAPYIVTEQLAYNTRCHVSETYLTAHMEQFQPFQPAPIVMSHLTATLFQQFQHDLQLSLDILYDYYEYIAQHDFDIIFDILSQEQTR